MAERNLYYNYLASTARPGGTMSRYGMSTTLGNLHPTFQQRLSIAIQQARAAGINASAYSSYRAPGWGVGAFRDKFNSLHAYGLAVDVTGIGRPGSVEARKWYEIAKANGIYNPYGPNSRKEWNHYQAVPEKGEVFVAKHPELKATITKKGPIDLNQMWAASGVPIEAGPNMDATRGMVSPPAPIPNVPDQFGRTPEQLAAFAATTNRPQDAIRDIMGLPGPLNVGSEAFSPPPVTGLPDPMADRGTGLERAIDNRAAQILTARTPSLPGALGSGPGPSAPMPQMAGGNPNIHTLGAGDRASNLHGVGPDTARAMPYTAGMGVPPAMPSPSPALVRSMGGVSLAEAAIPSPAVVGPQANAFDRLTGAVAQGPPEASIASPPARATTTGYDPLKSIPVPSAPAPTLPSVFHPDFEGTVGAVPQAGIVRAPVPQPEPYRGPAEIPLTPQQIQAKQALAQQWADPVVPAQPRRGLGGLFGMGGGGLLGLITGGRGIFGGAFQPRTSTGRFANGALTRYSTGATASPFVGVGGSAYGSRPYTYASGTSPDPSNPHP